MRKIAAVIVATALVFAAGCGDDAADAEKPIPPTPTIDQFQGGMTSSAPESPRTTDQP